MDISPRFPPSPPPSQDRTNQCLSGVPGCECGLIWGSERHLVPNRHPISTQLSLGRLSLLSYPLGLTLESCTPTHSTQHTHTHRCYAGKEAFPSLPKHLMGSQGTH